MVSSSSQTISNSQSMSIVHPFTTSAGSLSVPELRKKRGGFDGGRMKRAWAFGHVVDAE